MRMMGANSVAYHQATVMGRADDHAGLALDYYGSRGETPLVWGGGGAARLGLNGWVTEAEYAAIYGPGGARHPRSGQRLAATRRPGMELVVSAHKSVAELGVIGRAEDMHRILDAERDATLAYLEGVTCQRGGRRGRLRFKTPTSGLVYAHTRHATSRAGDPCPHDHVLIANVVEMLDGQGGWKAADSILWRDHLHAATMAGRMASARVAVELGYGIEADPGPSGRLGHWRIAGIPDEVLEQHSKRAAEITEAVDARGIDSYRARNIAARDTRDVKRHTPLGELMPRWRAELAEAGWTVADLVTAVEVAGRDAELPGQLGDREVLDLLRGVLGAESDLSVEKVFNAADVVVAVAPSLFGRPVEDLPRVVARVLAVPETVALVGVVGARDRVYATATTLATEAAIDEVVAHNAGAAGAAVVPTPVAEAAIGRTEAVVGRPLTSGQAAAVHGICGEGRRVSLVLGVAGAGKTTALRCVADAYTTAGYEVVGTATSGQAARTLGRDAAIGESRTLASLQWRLDHRTLNLSPRHVVILDEAGMTDDPALLRLLTACEVAGAKVVLVGDHRQLGPVGPGGSLRALLNRHSGQVHVLNENVRQEDPGERQALAALRNGDVAQAVAWYAEHDRIRTAPDLGEAVRTMVDAWADDVAAGHDAALYALRRSHVDELNRVARDRMLMAGNLTGPTLSAGLRAYQAGDWIVTLAPGTDGQTVTSERGIVESVDVRPRSLVARMDDGRLERLAGRDLDADRLAHGYAVTVHRSQASTVDVAHRLEDGGGRSLAYVSMSRGRECNTIHVIADDLEQAAEDLCREWAVDRRARWAIDTGTPARELLDAEHDSAAPAGLRTALRSAREAAERQALCRAAPPDPGPERAEVERRLADARRARAELHSGQGRYADTPEGDRARQLAEARHRADEASRFAADETCGWRTRRSWTREAKVWEGRLAAAEQAFEVVAGPELERLDQTITNLEADQRSLTRAEAERNAWLAQHPEADAPQGSFDLGDLLDRLRPAAGWEISPEPNTAGLDRGAAVEPDLGIDFGP
jgi:conjugative relaxase-like TrwC/TraI family protein